MWHSFDRGNSWFCWLKDLHLKPPANNYCLVVTAFCWRIKKDPFSLDAWRLSRNLQFSVWWYFWTTILYLLFCFWALFLKNKDSADGQHPPPSQPPPSQLPVSSEIILCCGVFFNDSVSLCKQSSHGWRSGLKKKKKNPCALKLLIFQVSELRAAGRTICHSHKMNLCQVGFGDKGH